MKKNRVFYLLLAVFLVSTTFGSTACECANQRNAKAAQAAAASSDSSAAAASESSPSADAASSSAAAASSVTSTAAPESSAASTAAPESSAASTAPAAQLTSEAVAFGAKTPGAFALQEGTVLSVTKDAQNNTVEISQKDSSFVFHLKENVFVLDQKSGKFLRVEDLKKGMNLAFLLPKDAPMTLSLPPQISDAEGIIIKSDAGSALVSVYDETLTDAQKTLMLHVGENTKILSLAKSDKALTAEDIKGSEALVLYSAATKSIPAQTTPEVVMILGPGDAASTASGAGASSYVALRAAAEAKGYHVAWVSKTKPIRLTKGDMQIDISLDSQDFTFTHQTADSKKLDAMKKLELPPILENGRTMVPMSFIDALE